MGITSVSNPLFRMNAMLSSGQGTKKAWDKRASEQNVTIRLPPGVGPSSPRSPRSPRTPRSSGSQPCTPRSDRSRSKSFSIHLTPLQEQIFNFSYDNKIKFPQLRRSSSEPFYNTWDTGRMIVAAKKCSKRFQVEFLERNGGLSLKARSYSVDSMPQDLAVSFLNQASSRKNTAEVDESIPIHLETVDGEEVVADATVNQLINYTTKPNAVQSKDFIDTLLFTHRYWISSEELFQRLVARYRATFDDEENEEDRKNNELMVKLRVINVMKKWIEHPFHCFYEDERLTQALFDFCKCLEAAGGRESGWANHLTNTLQATTELANRKVEEDAGEYDNLKFVDIDPVVLAEQMTLYDAKMFQRIRATEIFRTAWLKTDKEIRSPNIMALTDRFNKASFWIATQIIQTDSLKGRVEVLKNVILLAEHLLSIGNFHGVMEIYASLNMGSIQRLKLTWKELPSKYAKKMQEISKVLDATGNFRKLREAVKVQDPPIVPFQGVFLGDLTTFEEIPDKLENGRINFEKMRLLAKVFSQITITQVMPYTFPPDAKMQRFLANLNCMSEADLYKRSKELESPSASNSSRTRSGSLVGMMNDYKARKKKEKLDKRAKLKNKHLLTPQTQERKPRSHSVS